MSLSQLLDELLRPPGSLTFRTAGLRSMLYTGFDCAVVASARLKDTAGGNLCEMHLLQAWQGDRALLRLEPGKPPELQALSKTEFDEDQADLLFAGLQDAGDSRAASPLEGAIRREAYGLWQKARPEVFGPDGVLNEPQLNALIETVAQAFVSLSFTTEAKQLGQMLQDGGMSLPEVQEPRMRLSACILTEAAAPLQDGLAELLDKPKVDVLPLLSHETLSALDTLLPQYQEMGGLSEIVQLGAADTVVRCLPDFRKLRKLLFKP